MDQIATPWDDADDIRAYSDYDLQYSRNWSTRIYDKDGTVEAKIQAYLSDGEFDYENTSEVLDATYRIGCAYYLDNETVPRDRDDFDIAYCIPPRGWIIRTSFEKLQIPEPVEPDEREDGYMQVSTPSVCDEITDMLVDEGVVEYKREVCLRGLNILVGQN